MRDLLLSALIIHLLIFIAGLIWLYFCRNSDQIGVYVFIFLLYVLIFRQTILLAITILFGAAKSLTLRRYENFQDLAWQVFHDCTAGTIIKVYSDLSIDCLGQRIDSLARLSTQKVIYVANYPSSNISYFAIGLLPKVALISLVSKYKKDNGVYNIFLRPFFNEQNQTHIPIIKQEANYDKLKQLMASHIKTKSICVFPEILGQRRNIYKMAPFRTGVFKIAHQLNIPIIPIVFDRIKVNSVGYIPAQHYNISVGPVIKPSDYSEVTTLIETVHNWMQLKLETTRNK